jgi:predicted metallopeptidase
MGNANLKKNYNDKNNLNESTPNKDINEIIDYIATNYILSMDFESLKKLYNKNYCDNLVILTSDIIEKYLTNIDITHLSDRIVKKDNLIFVNRNDFENINKLEPTNKKELCNGIAKFYITIAHIFASIITTINPVYIFTDLNGNLKKISLNERNKIPYGIKAKISLSLL